MEFEPPVFQRKIHWNCARRRLNRAYSIHVVILVVDTTFNRNACKIRFYIKWSSVGFLNSALFFSQLIKTSPQYCPFQMKWPQHELATHRIGYENKNEANKKQRLWLKFTMFFPSLLLLHTHSDTKSRAKQLNWNRLSWFSFDLKLAGKSLLFHYFDF